MKRKTVIAVCGLAALLLVGGGVVLAQKVGNSRVKVISMTQMQDYGGYSDTSLSGVITSNVSQDIYLGSTQTVKEIFVEEGDTVKEGDPLISFDVTLTSLELEMKKLDKEGIELNIKKARREIEKIKQTPADGGFGSEDDGFLEPEEPLQEDEDEEPAAALQQLDADSEPYMGSGTQEDPYHFLCGQQGEIKGSFLNRMAKEQCFFLIEMREGDMSNGALLKVWGQQISDTGFHAEDEEEYELNLKTVKKEEEIRNPEALGELNADTVNGEGWYIGDGTTEHPYIFLVRSDGAVKGSFFAAIRAKGGYFRIEVREGNTTDGILLRAWEQNAGNLKQEFEADAVYVLDVKKAETTDPSDDPNGEDHPSSPEEHPTNPDAGETVPEEPTPSAPEEPTPEAPQPAPETPAPEAETPENPGTDGISGTAAAGSRLKMIPLAKDTVSDVMNQGAGGGYSGSDIQMQIKEKESEIRNYQLDIKEADLEIARIEKELKQQTVKSTLNGVVKTVGDPKNPNTDGKPLIQVVSSEGLYVRGTIGELQLDQLQPGQEMNGYSYENGISFTAEVKEISPYPTEQDNGEAGANSSMYPFIAYIADADGLKNNSWAELSFTGEGADSNGVTVPKAFVRTGDGQYYVMIDDGDGKLKRQVVTISRVVWGEMYEISSGLSYEDKIAFPYGKDVKEGAKTEEGSLEDLY